MICQFCKKKEYEKLLSLRNHERCCSSNPNKIASPLIETNKKQNVVSQKRKDQGARLAAKYKTGELIHIAKAHTEATKTKLSKVAKERNLGGYVKGSGRGQKGWYKGFFCDSSWELAFIIYYIDHNLAIKRNGEKRKYYYNGKTKNYIPDFITDEGLVEIKGYRTKEWEAKLAANPDIKVYYENDLNDVFEYVHSKYGKNYINLYD